MVRAQMFITVALLAFAGHVPAQDAPPPNVVVVLVDDLGWTDLACQGSRVYETPNLDRLAAQGIRFTDAYAACSVCSPTRAALLTGRSPARTGVTDWIRARFQRDGGTTPAANPVEYVGGPRQRLQCPPNPFWLELEEVTLAEMLRAAGYATCHIGKWHLGDEAWYPQHQGFDENFGGCDYGQPPSYFDPYTNASLPQGIPGLPPRREGEYLTDREADEAVGFITRNKARPFFLFYAPYAVHTPIQAKADATARYVERLEALAKASQKNATYAAMVESVDQAMGKLMAALDAEGLAERTLVVFTSDNGGLMGPTDNAPLRSGKGNPYEGGIRVPLIVRWPGVVEAGRVSALPVTSVDWLPTIAAATGVAPPERALDGVSLLPHLRAADAALAERPLFWHFPHYRGEVAPHGMVRMGQWKLIEHYEGPTFELYALTADIGETLDLAPAQPERVRAMAATLDAHLTATGARRPRANPAYRPLPRVLLLGDSISMGYHADVCRLLRGEADVFRPMRNANAAENCAGTDHGLQRIDAWLAAHGGEWDVIHFNFGLHDLKRVDAKTGASSNDASSPHQSPPDEYRDQLAAIVNRLQATKAKLIFATTTPVPEGKLRPFRSPADAVHYNEAARALMTARGIEIDDLHAFVLPRLTELQRPNDVHFTPAGSRALAGEVVRHVRAALARR